MLTIWLIGFFIIYNIVLCVFANVNACVSTCVTSHQNNFKFGKCRSTAVTLYGNNNNNNNGHRWPVADTFMWMNEWVRCDCQIRSVVWQECGHYTGAIIFRLFSEARADNVRRKKNRKIHSNQTTIMSQQKFIVFYSSVLYILRMRSA